MVIEDCVYHNVKKSGINETPRADNADMKGMYFGCQPDELDFRSGRE